jgi:hypothetical protein
MTFWLIACHWAEFSTGWMCDTLDISASGSNARIDRDQFNGRGAHGPG